MLTFKEFIHICEDKKSTLPPNAVPGTYKVEGGVKSYTLAPYKGPSGPIQSEKKVKKLLDKQGGTGGGSIKKYLKTIEKIKEDIESRRQQLKQRQLKQVQAHKERVAAYQSSQRKRIEKQREREQLKREIKRELQTEQTPAMQPTPFNVMKAREQARGGIAHRRHVHGELAREAGAQQAAKRQRLNRLMSK